MHLERDGWRVASASVQGTSHVKSGQPCQDAHCWKVLSGNILVAAIADGAGSAQRADLGAQVTVQAVVQAVVSQASKLPLPAAEAEWRSLLRYAIKSARASVEQAADLCQAEPKDLAATVILAIATPDLVAVAQVGDGAAVLSDRSGNIESLTVPPAGEYINETVFITSDSALETVQLQLWHGTPAQIAIFSDGLQMLALKLPEGKPHEPFFSPLFRFMVETTDTTFAKEQLIGFLKSERIAERSDDDLTLLLATLVD